MSSDGSLTRASQRARTGEGLSFHAASRLWLDFCGSASQPGYLARRGHTFSPGLWSPCSVDTLTEPNQ